MILLRRLGRAAMLHLSRVILSNWRNFRYADIPLQSRMFIVGPNASGKSNILDGIRFLKDVASGGGLRTALETRGGVSKVRSLFARDPSDILLCCELADEDGRAAWKYELVFNQASSGIQQLRPVVKSERVWKDSSLIYDRADTPDGSDKDLEAFTTLEQPLGHRPFKEVVEFLSNVRYLHLVPQIIRSSGVSMAARQGESFGSDFIARAATLNTATRSSYLRRISKALQIAVPQFGGLELVKDDLGKPHLEATFRHWRPQGAHQREDQFSDGTVRLVGFLWAILDGQGTVLLEEPELSLHPAIVRNLAEMIVKLQKRKDGRRQVIATSHSRDLLSSPGIAGEEIAALRTGPNGTEVQIASTDEQLRTLLNTGIPPGDVVLPATAPANVEQLLLEL
jgi:predicted ATPase